LFAKGGLMVFKSIAPKMHPDLRQGIRGMIDVFEGYLPIQDVFGVIQGCIDPIIHFLLEIGLFILSQT